MKMKLKTNTLIACLIGAVIVLLCAFIYVCLELKQSHANERSLSQRIDVLMKEKGRP